MVKIPKTFYHKCKICGEETNVRFNIDFNEVFICEGCAVAITTQQVVWYSRTYLKDDNGLYVKRENSKETLSLLKSVKKILMKEEALESKDLAPEILTISDIIKQLES